MVKGLCYKLEGRWFDPSWCHWNFSFFAMALGSTQPLTEMSARSISCGVKMAAVMKSGNLNFLEPSGPLQACNGTALP